MRENLKKNVFLFICMVCCLISMFGRMDVAKAGTGEDKENSQFEIQAETSLGNCVKIGRNCQMKVTVTNHAGDFNGLVQVLTEVNSATIMYQQDFSIAGGETKTIEIPFRMQSGHEKMIVRVTDMEERVLAKEKIKVTIVESYEYCNGVLTDNKQGMEYLEKYTKVTWLNKNNMPDSEEEIAALDRIYINNFQTAKLSKEQYAVLKKWIKNGGDLVIGTGANANDTLGIFQDDFLKGKIGNQDKEGRVELNFEGAKTHQDKNGNYMIHSIQIGKGNIWVYNIDLSLDKKDWQKTSGIRYIDYQLSEQFDNAKFPNTGNENAIYSDGTLNIMDADRLPDMNLYGVIFIVYIVCVSFLVFFVLKKKDKLEKTWVVVPVFAVIFIGLVYLLGSKTRIIEPYLMYRGEIRFSGEGDTNPNEKEILEFSSASNSNYTLAIPKGRTVYTEEGDTDDDTMITDDAYQIGFYQSGDNQYVNFKDVSAFDRRLILSEEKRKMGEGYECNMRGNQFKYQGTFTNRTGYTLKYAVFIVGNVWYKLGDIKDGETVEINKKTPKKMLSEFNDNSYEKMEEFILGEKDEKLLSLEAMRYKMIHMNSGFPAEDDYNGVVVSCIDLKEDRKKMKEEWGMNCDGITICRMPVKIAQGSKEEIFVPSIYPEGKDVDGIIDKADWTFDYAKTRSVDVEYSLKKGETLTGIYYLKEENPSIYKTNPEVIDFMGEVLAYNYKTKKYEVIFENGKEKIIKKVSDYVGEDNVLKIRIETSKQTKEEEQWESLPTISISKKKENK